MGAAELRTHQVGETVSVVLDRDQIERCAVDEILPRLFALTADAASAKRFEGRIELRIAGYDGEARAPEEIAEVRHFVRRLDAHFPYWFHFASLDGDTLPLLARCVCSQPGRATGLDPAIFARFVEAHYFALDHLYLSLGLDHGDNLSRSRALEHFIADRGLGASFH